MTKTLREDPFQPSTSPLRPLRCNYAIEIDSCLSLSLFIRLSFAIVKNSRKQTIFGLVVSFVLNTFRAGPTFGLTFRFGRVLDDITINSFVSKVLFYLRVNSFNLFNNKYTECRYIYRLCLNVNLFIGYMF